MFFRSTRFKVLVGIVLILAVIVVVFGNLTHWSAPQTNIIGAIVKPFQSFSASVKNSADDFFASMKTAKQNEDEKKKLQNKINKLTSQLLDYQKISQENQFYKDFLELKEKNKDFKLMPAMLTARDQSNPYGTFTINKGVLDGVNLHDPVITSEGLVGYISEASTTQSKVMTILNPQLNVSATDQRTRDSGIITGSADLAGKGKTKLTYLPRSNTAAQNDLLVSSGAGGVFPEGLFIGTIDEIKMDKSDISYYAVITPAVDFTKIRDVMVITSFNGQGGITE